MKNVTKMMVVIVSVVILGGLCSACKKEAAAEYDPKNDVTPQVLAELASIDNSVSKLQADEKFKKYIGKSFKQTLKIDSVDGSDSGGEGDYRVTFHNEKGTPKLTGTMSESPNSVSIYIDITKKNALELKKGSNAEFSGVLKGIEMKEMGGGMGDFMSISLTGSVQMK